MANLGAQKEKLSQQKMEHETEVSTFPFCIGLTGCFTRPYAVSASVLAVVEQICSGVQNDQRKREQRSHPFESGNLLNLFMNHDDHNIYRSTQLTEFMTSSHS